MNTPEWTKPAVYGALVGAVVVSIIGFSWGGWVTGGTADKMAKVMSHENVIAALLPMCVDMSATDADRDAKLAAIREVSSYRRRDAVMEAGWATVPGADAPNRDLAQACVAALEIDAS